MSIEQVYKCDGCNKSMGPVESMKHAGTWSSALNGIGITSFHACSVACGIKHMRANADALEKKEKAAAEEKAARDKAMAEAAAAAQHKDPFLASQVK